MKVVPQIITDGSYRVTNTYDYLGRRVERMTEIYKVATGDWTVATDTRYLYDGWNVIVEFDGETGNMSKQYTWGLDLSNKRQGAGGVGGLLACNDLRGTATTSDDAAYIYCYDANGNVRELLDSKDGTLAGLYDYDPYGNLLSSSGAEAATNRYRFSTKPWDDVAGLYYYGYRFYSAALGRWVNRDPIGEKGGANVSRFNVNNPISYVDRLGLKSRLVIGTAQLWDEDLIGDDLLVELKFYFTADCTPSGFATLRGDAPPGAAEIANNGLDSTTPGTYTKLRVACENSTEENGYIIQWNGGADEGDSPAAEAGGAVGGTVGGVAGGIVGGIAGSAEGGIGAIPGAIAGTGVGGSDGTAIGAALLSPFELIDDEIEWRFQLRWLVCCDKCVKKKGALPTVKYLGATTLKLKTNSWNWNSSQSSESDSDYYPKYKSETKP